MNRRNSIAMQGKVEEKRCHAQSSESTGTKAKSLSVRAPVITLQFACGE